jgi:hypothetical protein
MLSCPRKKPVDVFGMLACHKEYCSASMSRIVQADSGLSHPLRDHTGCRMRPSENRHSSDAVRPTRDNYR